MFTGIVEEAGRVERIQPAEKSIQLTVRAGITGRGLKVGGSLAVNGCCLTVVKLARRGKQTLPSLICCWRRGSERISSSRCPVRW